MKFNAAKKAFQTAMDKARDADARQLAGGIASAIGDYRARPATHTPLFRACSELFELRRKFQVRSYLPDGGRRALAQALVELLWSAVQEDMDAQVVVANHFPDQVRRLRLRQAETAAA